MLLFAFKDPDKSSGSSVCIPAGLLIYSKIHETYELKL